MTAHHTTADLTTAIPMTTSMQMQRNQTVARLHRQDEPSTSIQLAQTDSRKVSVWNKYHLMYVGSHWGSGRKNNCTKQFVIIVKLIYYLFIKDPINHMFSKSHTVYLQEYINQHFFYTEITQTLTESDKLETANSKLNNFQFSWDFLSWLA